MLNPTQVVKRSADHHEVIVGGDGRSAAATVRLVEAILRKTESIDLVEVERANGSMDAVADRMFASVPGAHVLDEKIGPFYDTAGLRKWFATSRQNVDAQVKAGDILCLLTSDNHRLYPSFQFSADGRPLPRLREVLVGLDPHREDPWGDAVWLNAPARDLEGSTPAEALRNGRADQAIRLAQQAGGFRL
ncbi:MAG: hypothetical protein JWP75_917 [Frondihabitans sp.]|nr:hypothetical protein [Frondihabitans sp.]